MPVRDPYPWFHELEDLADRARAEGALELARAFEALARAVLRGRETYAAPALEASLNRP